MRIGVNTGEALVTIDARPEAGEGMAAGDVVNTAARLQSARAGRTACSSASRPTERHERAIEYGDDAARSRRRARPSPFPSGRRCRRVPGSASTACTARRSSVVHERSRCSRTRSTAHADERSPQLVTLVGVPGIGKSRLVLELFHAVERHPELIHWRHGRCLPYGEGVTFWALGEIVKAQAGILESDSEAERRGEARVRSPARRPLGRVAPAPARRAGRRGGGARRRPRRGVRGLAPLLRGARRASGRSCSCSRTCTGPTTVCSTSSTTSSTGRAACRCSSSAPRARSCSSGGPAGAAGSRTRSRSRSSPLSDDETGPARHVLLGVRSPGRDPDSSCSSAQAATHCTPRSSRGMLRERGGRDGALPETVQGLIAARLDAARRRARRRCSRTPRSSARASGPARRGDRG